MKSFLSRVADAIALEAIEKFANRLFIKLETAFKQTNKAEYEFALKVLQDELEKAREELNEDM